MRDIPDIRGLRFPDAFVVRHFFKAGLHERPGKVLELGSGTGNNLLLYQAYGWQVTGLDYDAAALEDAAWNLEGKGRMVQADLAQGLPDLGETYDVLLAPNVINYVTGADAERVLTSARRVIPAGAPVFVSARLTDDYRYGRGKQVEEHGFILDTVETGEAGLLNRFYTADGLVDLLDRTLGLTEREELSQRFDNVQGGVRVRGNSDLIVWGKAG